MKKKYTSLTLALVGALSASQVVSAKNNSNERYIIKYKPSHYAKMSMENNISGVKIKRRIDAHNLVSAELSATALEQLKKHKGVSDNLIMAINARMDDSRRLDR